MTYVYFGNLTIPAIWLAAAVALVLVPLFYRLFFKKKIEDWFWNGFLLFFAVWKFSYIIFHFSTFIDVPVSVLYFNGGTKGQILALLSLSIYLAFSATKKYQSVYDESTNIFLLYFICYKTIVSLFDKSISESIVYFVLLGGLVGLFLFLKNKKREFNTQLFIALFLLILTIHSLFRSIISIEILIFLWIGISILVVTRLFNKEEKKIYE